MLAFIAHTVSPYVKWVSWKYENNLVDGQDMGSRDDNRFLAILLPFATLFRPRRCIGNVQFY